MDNSVKGGCMEKSTNKGNDTRWKSQHIYICIQGRSYCTWIPHEMLPYVKHSAYICYSKVV